MNTPAHAVINLLLLARNPDHRQNGVIVAGALLPDLVIMIFYAWHLLIGTPEYQIWSVEYFDPLWQAWIDGFNSIPILALAILICWHQRSYLWLLFFASMLLHSLGDLPLHHDDGHRHFFPFLDWRFSSPISYWDPAHYGYWVGLFEIACVLGASIYLFRKWASSRPWIGALAVSYLSYGVYVFIVWM